MYITNSFEDVMKMKAGQYSTNLTARKHWLKAVHFTVISPVAVDGCTLAVDAGDVTRVMRRRLSDSRAHLLGVVLTTSTDTTSHLL